MACIGDKKVGPKHLKCGASTNNEVRLCSVSGPSSAGAELALSARYRSLTCSLIVRRTAGPRGDAVTRGRPTGPSGAPTRRAAPGLGRVRRGPAPGTRSPGTTSLRANSPWPRPPDFVVARIVPVRHVAGKRRSIGGAPGAWASCSGRLRPNTACRKGHFGWPSRSHGLWSRSFPRR